MKPGNRLLFIFLDGVGLGPDDPASNPFAVERTPQLAELLGGPLVDTLQARTLPGLTVKGIDATLDTPGLPQSATGQASLLTGSNAARVMGGHYGPWPGPTLRRMLDEGNLFSRVGGAGLSAIIANAYPPGYFRALEQGRSRTNAPVHAALQAGVSLRGLADFEAGDAVGADLTGALLRRSHPELRSVSAAETGSALRQLALRHDFTFFDFWLSDHVGHRGSFADAAMLVRQLGEFLAEALPDRNDGLTVLVTSDHGNLEDKTVRTHTRAPVPLLASGPGAAGFAGVTDLTGVAPVIGRLLAV